MKFLIYLLRCIPNGISLIFGRSDLTSDSIKELLIGGLEIIVIISIYFIFYFKLYYNKKYRILWSILTTIGVLLMFALICIIIELLIDKL